jgi:peptide/nickel transport system ATP-binding protein
LSGGERQRVAIARALIVKPDILVCDEVLSALDVSVQASILELLGNLCRQQNVALLFISHDLAVVRSIAHRIGVLYRGEFLAFTNPRDLLTPPLHPYVHELLSKLPSESIARTAVAGGNHAPEPLSGGCLYASRCPVVRTDLCRSISPPWQGSRAKLRCHLIAAELERTLPLMKSEPHEQVAL